MAIWKEQNPPKKESAPMPQESVVRKDNAPGSGPSSYDIPRRPDPIRESVLASDLNIEGKIEGAGHVRIAGRFKGDVHVQGNLTIESGAKVTGSVRASTVIIGGELEGNIEAASRVELLESGVLNGDLKAGSLTVAAGSRMRGQVEFGFEDRGVQKPALKVEAASAS